jgi:CDP-diacylglycerol--serine O-phosphatidyltransferase
MVHLSHPTLTGVLMAPRTSPFIGYINPPTILTLGGIILAMLSVYFSQEVATIPLTAIFLMLAGICDLFDGFVARKCNLPTNQQDYGVHIDTVADMASFGVAPALICINLGLTSPLEITAGLVYICCAGTRLAYFNTIATKTDGPVPFFTGLPVTYAAMIFPVLLYFCCPPGSPVNPLPLHGALWLIALLFILRIPIPKPKGALYVLLPAVAVGFSYLWIQRL